MAAVVRKREIESGLLELVAKIKMESGAEITACMVQGKANIQGKKNIIFSPLLSSYLLPAKVFNLLHNCDFKLVKCQQKCRSPNSIAVTT